MADTSLPRVYPTHLASVRPLEDAPEPVTRSSKSSTPPGSWPPDLLGMRSPRRCLEELYFLGHQQGAELRGEAVDEILVRKHSCALFNAKGRTGLCLAAPSWLSPFPTIPQWKRPIVPCPSKVTLSNATSPMSIKKGSGPVRGLWSKPRPFVVTSKLSMPIICYDRRSPVFHLAVS